MTAAPVPRATYRLQLSRAFRFADVAARAPYLERLGISHVYLSPISMARAGSNHGYDVVDHTRLNPELGTEDDFVAMAAELRRHGLGIVLDIVPNHMAVGGADNVYWLDVLEHGEASRYAGWFDIDWHPTTPGLAGKLLVPFLGKPYAEALHAGDIELRFDARDGRCAVWAHGTHKLPLSPATGAGLAPNDVASLNADKPALDALIAKQHWRLADGRYGDAALNYRRFFIVSELAGIRVERPEVFDHVHALPLRLVAGGLIDGLRIDHIDGLYDPKAYCHQLRAAAARPIYIVAEKILTGSEALRPDWGLDGTTGYEFASLVTPLLVDPAGQEPLEVLQRRLGIARRPFAEVEVAGKRAVMEHSLAAEIEAMTARLAHLAGDRRPPLDLDAQRLRTALVAVLAAFPVYRTYVDAAGANCADRRIIESALDGTRQSTPAPDPAALDFVGRIAAGAADGEPGLDVARRLQQLTGPVMAKGLEDTALYRDNRLLALNDVGERPEPFSIGVPAFHEAIAVRAMAVPATMLATSTHDSKRGEDGRWRLAALSGCAEEWAQAVVRWRGLLQCAGAPAIDPEDLLVFFQLLLAAWPGKVEDDLAERLVGGMHKSLREARLRSSWTAPDTAYEEEMRRLVRLALTAPEGAPFRDDFLAFEPPIGRLGALNGLVATTLKLTVPGVPDIYQGAERWCQNLPDPDNRRGVDFAGSADLFDRHAGDSLEDLLAAWRNGTVKQQLTARLLRLRRAHPALFAEGRYEPLATDDADGTLCAFLRRHEQLALFVVVRLHPWRKVRGSAPAPPPELQALHWTDVLRDRCGLPADLAPALAVLPIAVFLGQSEA